MLGLTRLSSEAGLQSMILADRESSILKVLREAEISLRNLQLVMKKEHGVKFQIAPVSGYNFHVLVERKIRRTQDCFDKEGFLNKRFHATGLQTLCILVEIYINNLPLGYAFSRDQDNSLLKLITPNLLRLGRLNTQPLNGPIRLPTKFAE